MVSISGMAVSYHWTAGTQKPEYSLCAGSMHSIPKKAAAWIGL